MKVEVVVIVAINSSGNSALMADCEDCGKALNGYDYLIDELPSTHLAHKFPQLLGTYCSYVKMILEDKKQTGRMFVVCRECAMEYNEYYGAWKAGEFIQK